MVGCEQYTRLYYSKQRQTGLGHHCTSSPLAHRTMAPSVEIYFCWDFRLKMAPVQSTPDNKPGWRCKCVSNPYGQTGKLKIKMHHIKIKWQICDADFASVFDLRHFNYSWHIGQTKMHFSANQEIQEIGVIHSTLLNKMFWCVPSFINAQLVLQAACKFKLRTLSQSLSIKIYNSVQNFLIFIKRIFVTSFINRFEIDLKQS